MVWVEVDTGVEIVTTRGRTGPQMETINEHRHGNHQMIITMEIVTGIIKDGCHHWLPFVYLPYVYGNMNDVLHQTERCYGVGAILRMLPSTTK
jgi:hypothetical protein